MEGDVVTLQDLFPFDFRAGLDERGRFRGSLRADRPAAAVRRHAGRRRYPPAAARSSPRSTRSGGIRPAAGL